jgi:outer membrane protein assembly factor BamB
MNSRSPFFTLIAVAGIVGLAGVSQARTWTQSATGKKIEADFVKLDGETVVLNVGGRQAQVPLNALSAEDQAYVKEANAKPAGAGGAGSADWPQWRGVDRSDISPDTGLLKTWPEGGPKKLWVFEDAGMGYASFIVVDGKLFTIGTRGSDVYAISIDTNTGKEIWSTKFGTDDQQGYAAGWGHGPRSTPTYDDGHIYVLDAKGNLAALDAAKGDLKWSKNLISDFGGQAGGWGFAESPLIDGDKLVVCPGGQKAGIVALDKKTGSTIWEAADVKPGKAEYASIVPVEINGKRQYVRLFESQVVSVDAADGKQLWTSDWPGKTAVIPTPIIDGNEIYVTSGYGVGSKLFKVAADNTTSDVWMNTVMKNHHGGVVKVGDHLYGFSDGGGLICQDWKTGELVWSEKGRFTTKGSVHVADGKIYALNEGDGTVVLAEVSPDGFKQLGQFTLDPQSSNRHPQGKVWTHPVVIGGKLYLRDQEYIVSYDVTG